MLLAHLVCVGSIWRGAALAASLVLCGIVVTLCVNGTAVAAVVELAHKEPAHEKKKEEKEVGRI